jgi:energy-coupling factor transport system ATP-binding protein
VEHRLHEAISDSERLLVLRHGQVVADGAPRDVLSREISESGLNLPPLVRLFRTLGWRGDPLTEDEAFQALKAQNLLRSALSKLAASAEALSETDIPKRHEEPVIVMENVWFDYQGSSVLRGVTLTLKRGECVALVGRNGAGKTTLIKLLNGLLKPKQGSVEVLGRDTLRTPVRRLVRHVGFAWQNPNDQLFQATVRDEVLTGPRALGLDDPGWCNLLFERFDLGPLLARSPFLLSEGQKKRVSFAAALSSRPEAVVLDEPTAGQDESFRRELGKFISELAGEGRTVLLVTHDLEFAAEHAGRWIVLGGGRVIADGPPEGVMADTSVMSEAGLRPTQRFRLMQALRNSVLSDR